MSLALNPQLFINGAWTTYPGYSEDGWETSVGPDLESGLQPNRLTLTLANDDLTMDPSNPVSPLYGKTGRNIPCRVLIDGTATSTGEASSWVPDRTVEHQPGVRGRSSVDLTGEGLLRRLGRWTDPIRSPMTRRTLGTSSLLGFWPLEDPSGSLNLAQMAATTAPAGTFDGDVSLSGDPGAGGSDEMVKMATNGSLNGRFPVTTGNGWQFSFVAKLATLPVSTTYVPMMQIYDADGRIWSWLVNNDSFKIRAEAGDGSFVKETGPILYGTLSPNKYARYRLRVTYASGTVTFEPAWYVQDSNSVAGITDTFSDTTARRPIRWRVPGSATLDGAGYGHVYAVTSTAIDLIAATELNGFIGETAADRFSRLMAEEGLTSAVSGNAALSVPMGRQKPGIFLDLIDEARRTDGGLIYDTVTAIGLTFRLRNHIIATAPVLTLTYGVNLSPPLKKVIDDVRVVNDLTVSNSDGTKLQMELTSGRLSTAPPPAGVGRYKGTLDISVRDQDQMAQRGNFELDAATLDRPRYPAVTVDLLAFPALRPTINAMRPGALITVVGVEADPVTLLVVNIGRRGDTVTDTATLNCVPGDIWDVGSYDNTSYRYDARTTTLGSGISSSATSLTLSSTDKNDVWSSTSAYDVVIGGERIGIPAGGMSTQAGSGPYTQTATGVTRAKNGVSKSQVSGEPIHVYRPARWA